MDKKNMVIALLVVLVVALGGLSYYLYSQGNTCKSLALECESTATGLGAKLQQCVTGLQTCQTALTGASQ